MKGLESKQKKKKKKNKKQRKKQTKCVKHIYETLVCLVTGKLNV